MRVAVLGTYLSGSSVVAGILHHLGVDMGGPFYGQYFESAELSQALRHWWSEPRLIAAMASRQRREHLKTWITYRQQRSAHVGAMHPLLSLCGPDIVAAWGEETQFIWCQRPIEDAIISLNRKGWWPDSERIQKRIYEANSEFFQNHPHIAIAYRSIQTDPENQVLGLAKMLGLQPTVQQVEQSIAWLQGTSYNQQNSTGSEVAMPLKSTDVERPYKIVATMLSGNSEAIVAEAVESIIDWVDEFCLIDTGITDNTQSIVANIAGSKFSRSTFSWCNDFASARNAALHFANQREATWALTVDTDERFTFPGIADRHTLREILQADRGVQAWMVSARDNSYCKERFIRVPSKATWQGRTHEALTAEGGLTRELLQGCYFWEAPKTVESYQHKVERDLEILLEETRLQPLNPRWWYYLGQTYEGLKDYRKAVEAHDRCIRLDGWSDESAWACYTAARCLVTLQEYRDAEEYCSLGLSRKPSSAELPWLAGWCCFQRGDFKSAVVWCKLSIVLGREKSIQNAATFRHVPAWYEAPYDVLRHAFKQLGKIQEAEQAERDYHIAKRSRLGTASE